MHLTSVYQCISDALDSLAVIDPERDLYSDHKEAIHRIASARRELKSAQKYIYTELSKGGTK